MLLNKEKEICVKFNGGLSANQHSNNWALLMVLGEIIDTRWSLLHLGC